MATKADVISPTQQKVYYSDFTTNLDPHPDKKDLLRYLNEDAVTTSIKNLLMTFRFERLNKPLVGSGIRRMLFEPIDIFSEASIRESVLNTIENFEPRANVTELIVSGDPDNNLYNVTLTFTTINRSDPVTIQLLLHRVR
jgi:phage baseplate assembly protein W